MNIRAVQSRARDKKIGMTLEELSSFVIDAQHLGIPADTKIEVTIGFRSNIHTLRAEGEASENS